MLLPYGDGTLIPCSLESASAVRMLCLDVTDKFFRVVGYISPHPFGICLLLLLFHLFLVEHCDAVHLLYNKLKLVLISDDDPNII